MISPIDPILTAGAQDPAAEHGRARSDQWLNVRDCGVSGSDFETGAVTTAGARQITAADPGDFRPGQDVVLFRGNPHLSDRFCMQGGHINVPWPKERGDPAELRGYNGSQGDWLILFLDMPKGGSATFRWSDNFGRAWQPVRPITGDWQPLRDGLEVRFNPYNWESGYTVVLSLRSHLATAIEAIEGNRLTLRDAPTHTVQDAVLRHRADDALQTAIDRAIREKRNVFFPTGRYRLLHGLFVRKAEGITIEGASGLHAILDISEGEGNCLTLEQGGEVNIRNFKMIGHSGYDKRDCCGAIGLLGASSIWGFAANMCAGVGIHGTERVLMENCHGTRMSHECFYSRGPHREGLSVPEHYTKEITFLRCSVVDSARNAFNNNDFAENTSVLYCRIVDVGGCAWEGSSRFVRFIGNYVRNAGTVAMGNIRGRTAHLEELPSGQHIVADNVFEGRTCYGLYAICASAGATQIVIRNNLFVNFNTSAVWVLGAGSAGNLPASNAIVTGNIFDMTNIGEKSRARTAIHVAAPDMLVNDNQIYVRGAPNRDVTAIRITEPALNAIIHDNLIRNCGEGIVTAVSRSNVGCIIDPQTFTPAPATAYMNTYEYCLVPSERRQSHRYCGWTLVALQDGRPTGTLVIEDFDPETVRFRTRQPHGLAVDQAFEVIAPTANWNMHANTIDGCLKPVQLISHGGPTSLFRDNLITRGMATRVPAAVVVSGAFKLIGNTFAGFDEPDTVAMVLAHDRFGQAPRSIYRANMFERCTCAVQETEARLWEAGHPEANLFIACQTEVRPAADGLKASVIKFT